MGQKRSDLWSRCSVWVLVACALVVTALVVRRELLLESGVEATQPVHESVAEWRDVAAVGYRLGPVGARATIVQFVDFRCVYCRTFAKTLEQISYEYEGDVALVFRHFPLDLHPHSTDAAVASECAGQQDAFWGYHDALFADQDAIGGKAWSEFAIEAGVPDLGRFELCMSGVSSRAAVLRDVEAGQRLGIDSTPTSLLNGRLLRGAVTARALRREINALLGS